MDIESKEILFRLKNAGSFFELYEVTTFMGYRNDTQGNVCAVEIKVFDSGEPGSKRYHVIAEDEHGRIATGNPASTIDEAITFVHWFDLDKPKEAKA